MPIEAVTYYEASCDACGRRAEFGDFTAYKERGAVVDDLTHDSDWTTDGTRWHCCSCPCLFVLGEKCEECSDHPAVKAFGRIAVCAACAREFYEARTEPAAEEATDVKP